MTLSNYGSQRKFNRFITSLGANSVGVVWEIKPRTNYPYKVRWQGKTRPGAREACAVHGRRELKYAYSHKKKGK